MVPGLITGHDHIFLDLKCRTYCICCENLHIIWWAKQSTVAPGGQKYDLYFPIEVSGHFRFRNFKSGSNLIILWQQG